MKKYLKSENILLAVGIASLGVVVVGKVMGKSKFKNFTPYVNPTLCLDGSAAGENRGEFMGGRCI